MKSAASGAFLTAAGAMVVLFFALALALATARARLVETMEQSAVRVKRWAGWVLVAVGVWLIVLGVFAETFAAVFPV